MRAWRSSAPPANVSWLLGGTGLATWTTPKGGYFITLDVLDGCAREVVRRAADIALVPAGATHPCRHDPRDRTIRIAPSYPDITELEQAISGLATCVRLAGYEKLAAAQRYSGVRIGWLTSGMDPGLDETVAVGIHHGLDAVTQVEFAEHPADVGLDGGLG